MARVIDKQKRDKYRKFIFNYMSCVNINRLCSENGINTPQLYKFTYGENTLSQENIDKIIEALYVEMKKIHAMSEQFLKEIDEVRDL